MCKYSQLNFNHFTRLHLTDSISREYVKTHVPIHVEEIQVRIQVLGPMVDINQVQDCVS